MSVDKQTKKGADSHHYGLLKGPLVTEKAAQQGLIVLSVDPRATKTEIKDAVERVFNVTVARVRTANYSGKPKRVGRSIGRRAGFKKAYITLAEGSEINLVEGV